MGFQEVINNAIKAISGPKHATQERVEAQNDVLKAQVKKNVNLTKAMAQQVELTQRFADSVTEMKEQKDQLVAALPVMEKALNDTRDVLRSQAAHLPAVVSQQPEDEPQS